LLLVLKIGKSRTFTQEIEILAQHLEEKLTHEEAAAENSLGQARGRTA
jgi:hypothetical protein